MTIDQIQDPAGRQARYRQIAEGLRRQIVSGVYRPGDKLPTELELAHLHGVSRVTSAAALAVLAREGLVERAPRRGTVVRPHANRDTATVRPLLAWIQPSVDYAFGLDLFRGIEQAARANGFNLLVRLTGTSRADEEQAIRDAVAAGAVGMALFLQDGETYNAEVLRLVLDGFPVVLVDRHLRGVQCASVGSDNVAGARSLVGELVRQGHRTICALVFPVKGTSTIEDRLDGYTQALTAAGIPIDHSLIYVEERIVGLPGLHISDALIERFAGFLRSRPDVTAIFASNAQLTLLAMHALARLRLRVPEDLSLVSIDGLRSMPLIQPALTCAVQQSYEMGVKAVDLLQEGLQGKASHRLLLPMHIEEAHSIAPPGRSERMVVERS